MSSKASKKNVPVTKSTNAVTTRKKTAKPRRQARAKTKKPIKPVVTKQIPKQDIKSTNSPTAKCQKDTPLQTKVRHLVQLVEQVEYYPDKLKRDVCAKKVFLKPNHNFKVIASANKRKLAVPQKGETYSTQPLKKNRRNSNITPKNSSSEISMVEMVKLIEDTHCLSDEDFMEILTCPSPVWWEDPPDEGYFEDAICTRLPSPSSPVNKISRDNNTGEQINTPNALPSIDFENVIDEFNITPKDATTPEKFNKKKQKLENILGNIKSVKKSNVRPNPKTQVNIDREGKKDIERSENKNKIKIGKGETRNVSNNTDEEDMSDLSFNEEEVLKNLENMDIPIEQSQEQALENIKTRNELNEDVVNNDELKIPDILPPLKRKPDIKVNDEINQDFSDNLDINIDAVSHSNFRFISDDDINFVESNTKNSKNMKIVNISSSLGESSSVVDVDTVDLKDYAIKAAQFDDSITDSSDKNNDFIPKKVLNDLSEYITVYKIMSNDNEKNELNTETSTKSPDNSSNNKVENVRGKLNSFFKKCKSSKRLKKNDITFPAISVRDIEDLKMEKENSDGQNNVENEDNRLKTCDYCVGKTENGTKMFSCDRCENSPIFACALCNFLAETKEIYKKHITKCKDVDRISWKNNYIMNQS